METKEVFEPKVGQFVVLNSGLIVVIDELENDGAWGMDDDGGSHWVDNDNLHAVCP